MGLTNVIISVNRSGLGLVALTNDRIMGLILNGVAVVDLLELEKAYAIYGLAGAEALGITEFDETGEAPGDNAVAWKQIKEFYDEAGNGAKLWFIVTDEDLMSSNAGGTANALITLIEAAKGEIAVVGLCRGAAQTDTTVDGLDEDVWLAMTNVQTLADEYQGKIMPFSAVIDGVGLSDSEAALSLKTKTQHRCSVILAASDDDGVASVGQFLGRLAAGPVQRKASRVKTGALKNLNAYLTDGTSIEGRDGELGTLHDKGYIVYRGFPGRSGFYFSGDPTATAATDDLNIIARNRIIDKAIKIAYNTYVEELDDDVDMTDDGKLEPAVCASLQDKIDTQVNGNMSGEISKFSSLVDPNQDILSGLPLEVVLDIVPKGYLNTIRVTLGFVNPFSS